MDKEKYKKIVNGLDANLAADMEKVREIAKASKGPEELVQRILHAEEEARKAKADSSAKDAMLKQADRMLVKAQERVDKIELDKSELQRELRDFKNIQELKEYYKFFVENLKSQPRIMETVLKAAKGTQKIDILDPGKTQDLSEAFSIFFSYIGDIIRNSNEWGQKEAVLQGIAETATLDLSKAVGAVKKHLPEEDRLQLVQRIKKAEDAERSIKEAEKAQSKGEKIDKSKLESPESLGGIIADFISNVNKEYRNDELALVESLFGAEKIKEYKVLQGQQKKAEWVHELANNAIEQYKSKVEAAAEQKIAEAKSQLEKAEAARAAAEQKIAEAHSQFEKAEGACEAAKKECADYLTANKAQLLRIWQAIPRDIDAEGVEGRLAQAWFDGAKGETEDVDFEDIFAALKKSMEQRDNYKNRAVTAEGSATQAHELLGKLDEQILGKNNYIAELEKAVWEQAEKQKQIEEEKEKAQSDANAELEKLHEKVTKLESGEGFKFADYVLKTEYNEAVKQREEEIKALKKISEGHISKDEHELGVRAKEDEVRAEYLPVVLDQKTKIADLKCKMSELEKAVAEKGNASSAIAKEINDLKQQLEEANKRNVYNPDIHMPKAEHDAALEAKEKELHERYQPVISGKEELEQRVEQQAKTLAEKSEVLGQLQQKVEADAKAKAELEARTKQQEDALAENGEEIGQLQQKLEADAKSKSAEIDGLKLELEKAGKIIAYDPEKHVTIEKYQADTKQKEEQLAAKQKEFADLIKSKADADAKLVGIMAYDPEKHMPRDEHAVALEKKADELQKEYEPLVIELSDAKGKLLELEADAKAKDEIEKKLAEKNTELEKLKLELDKAGKIAAYDPEKHIGAEKYNADMKQREEQLAAKQKEIEDASKAKSALEQELAKARKDYTAEKQLALDEHRLAFEEVRNASKERVAGLEKAIQCSIEMFSADVPKLAAEARATDTAVDDLLKAAAEEANAKISAAKNLAKQAQENLEAKAAELEGLGRFVDKIILEIIGQEEYTKYTQQAFATQEDKAGWLKESVNRTFVLKSEYDKQVKCTEEVQGKLDAAGRKLEETLRESAQALDAAKNSYNQSLEQIQGKKEEAEKSYKQSLEQIQGKKDEAEKSYKQSLEQIQGKKDEAEKTAGVAQEMISAVLGNPDAFKEYLAIPEQEGRKAWLKETLSKLYRSNEAYAALEKKLDSVIEQAIALNRQFVLAQEKSRCSTDPAQVIAHIGKAMPENYRKALSDALETVQQLEQKYDTIKKVSASLPKVVQEAFKSHADFLTKELFGQDTKKAD